MREVLTPLASLAAPHGQVDLEKPSPADARAARNGFSSTRSLDDGAITVPFNGCTKRQAITATAFTIPNQSNPWTCVSARVPSHTVRPVSSSPPSQTSAQSAPNRSCRAAAIWQHAVSPVPVMHMCVWRRPGRCVAPILCKDLRSEVLSLYIHDLVDFPFPNPYCRATV